MKPTKELYLKAADVMEARGLSKSTYSYFDDAGAVCLAGAVLVAAVGREQIRDVSLSEKIGLCQPLDMFGNNYHQWAADPYTTTEQAAEKLRAIAETLS